MGQLRVGQHKFPGQHVRHSIVLLVWKVLDVVLVNFFVYETKVCECPGAITSCIGQLSLERNLASHPAADVLSPSLSMTFSSVDSAPSWHSRCWPIGYIGEKFFAWC